jgi:hypothetical protein
MRNITAFCFFNKKKNARSVYQQDRQTMASASATTRQALTADVEKTRRRQRPLVPRKVEGLPPATLRLTVHFQVQKGQIPRLA